MLAQKGDINGKEILQNLLNRDYLAQFPEIDGQEQNYILLVALGSLKGFKTEDLNVQIKKLSQSDRNMKVRNAALELLK